MTLLRFLQGLVLVSWVLATVCTERGSVYHVLWFSIGVIAMVAMIKENRRLRILSMDEHSRRRWRR